MKSQFLSFFSYQFLLFLCLFSCFHEVKVSGYNPSEIVHSFHHIPHLNNHLHPVSHSFGITAESRWNDYTDSLIPFPVIIGCISVLLILIPVGVLLSRYWCSCGKCLPEVVHEYLEIMMTRNPSRNPNFNKVVWYRQITTTSFFVCLIIVVILNQGVFIGEETRRSAVHKAEDSLSSMKKTFGDLSQQGYELLATGEVIESDLTAALPTCPEAQTAFEPLLTYQEAIIVYLEIVEPVPSRLGDLESYLYDWAVTFRNQMIWLIYGMVWMIVGIFFMSLCMKSQGSLKFGIGTGFCFTAVLFCVLAGIIYLLMMSADFCMSPTPHAVALCEEAYRDLAAYYSSCNGTNPIAEPIETAIVSIEKLDFTVSTLSAPNGRCPENPYLVHSASIITYAHGNLTLLLSTSLCLPIQNDWNSLFYDAVCDEGYQGLVEAWIADYSTLFMVYVTLLIGCSTYQYIGAAWRYDFDITDEMERERGEGDRYRYHSENTKDTLNSTTFHYFRDILSGERRESKRRGMSGGTGSEGSGGRSPQVGEYNAFQSYYIDAPLHPPLLSQDSDELFLPARDALRSRPEGFASTTPPGSGALSASGGNRNSHKLTPDLLPTRF